MAGESRDKLKADELAIVLSHYDLGLLQEVREFARGSHRAPKAIIRTDRGSYMLKRRPAGKNDPYRVAFAHELQNYLVQKNFPLPHLIGTREENNSMLRWSDSIYEVFEFIPGDRYDNSLLATYQAGKVLGLYHRLVHEYHPQWEPPRGHFHDAAIVRTYLSQIPERLAERESVRGRETALRDVCEWLREAYDRAAATADGLGLMAWETQIVHGDWHPGNMLFREGHVVAVIDYDAARVQPRVMDVANGVLQFSLVSGNREVESWPDYTDEPRAKRFLRGYDEMNLLSVAELNCIAPLMQEALIAEVVMPIWQTGTFARLDGFRFLKTIQRKVSWLGHNSTALIGDLASAQP